MLYARPFAHVLFTTVVMVLWGCCIAHAERPTETVAPKDYIAASFGGSAPAPETVSLTPEQAGKVRKILKRPSNLSSYTLWRRDGRTVVILDEIGKYQPITTGFTIVGGAISDVKVLAYRETHGWEVQYPYFTNQFIGMKLNKKNKPSKRLNGISGATLSVSALSRMAHLALYLDSLAELSATNQSG